MSALLFSSRPAWVSIRGSTTSRPMLLSRISAASLVYSGDGLSLSSSSGSRWSRTSRSC